MSQLAKHQPLMLRRRLDLVESVLVCQGDYVSVIKDPVSLQYFHLEGPDRCLLQLLDGRRTLSDVCEALQRQFPESQVEEHTVHSGIQRFHQQGLLISTAAGLGGSYLKRGRKQVLDKVNEFFSSILAMRFPGVNPTRFLDWCKPVVSKIFHPAVLTVCVIYMLIAACTLLVRLEEIYLEMPRVGAFFSFENLPFFVATIFLTKTIHEFGHAFVCHHFGAQPHAIGFMLLVLSPAAYCDASDSWMLKKKSQRILIAMAGMYFELILAATAVFVWLMTDPGWLHLFCVNLIIVSSVSTLVFNANPLLRYDGYYILSDYLEIPNMSKKANEWLLSVSRQLFLGMPPIRNLQLPDRKRTAFYIYAVAAFIYRWFVMAVIYWFLITLFESYHLAVIGYLLAVISIGKTLYGPLSKTWKFFTRHGATQEIQMPRLIYSSLLIAALIYAVLFVPLPRAEYAYLVTRPVNYRTAYAESAGVLKQVCVKPGEQVAKGDLLATLENHDLRKSVIELTSQQAQFQSTIEIYESFPEDASVSPLEFQQAVADLRKVESQLDERRQQLDNLQVRASCDGTVTPPITFGVLNVLQSGEQQTDVDCFESEALNRTLVDQTPICAVVESEKFEALAFVDQRSMTQLEIGQTVELLLDEYATKVLSGTLVEIKSSSSKVVPDGLLRQAGGYIEAGTGGAEGSPRIPHFQLAIQLDEVPDDLPLQTGMRGQAKIAVRPASIFQRFREMILRATSFR